jgi:hypothetical protein
MDGQRNYVCTDLQIKKKLWVCVITFCPNMTPKVTFGQNAIYCTIGGLLGVRFISVYVP